MLFNSLTFFVFLLTVYCVYWALDRKRQNMLLILAGYVFYGWWDWRFLSLLFFSSAIDYAVGRALGGTEVPLKRKVLLGISIGTQLTLLGFFKYFNFFAESFQHVAEVLGLHPQASTLKVILPVGISFYTFQTLSYTIDVYRRKCPPHKSMLDFFAFVSFFPQLIAGPIERATNLLGQFAKPRLFDSQAARDGLRQMLWGFAKKIIIADSLAGYVGYAFGNSTQVNGAELLLASIFFAFQIYCDFSGYSDIAIGCARLFGFNLMRNFNFPYFSRNVAEFWKRWHISLSTWFRDYLYIPLGGNRGTLARVLVVTVIVFTVSGLWHGANWTFVLWGLLNGLYFIPVQLFRRARGKKPLSEHAGLRDLPAIVVTFAFVLITWILFRSQDLSQALQVMGSILTNFDPIVFLRQGTKFKALIVCLLVIEWIQRRKQHPLSIEMLPRPIRWAIYNALLLAILLLGTFNYQPFIYFQF